MPVKMEKKDPEKLKNQKKVKAAIDALRLIEGDVKKKLEKHSLLEDEAESIVFLQIALKKIPPPQLLKTIGVFLPHSLITETSEVCLITGDLEKCNNKAEIEPTVLHYKDLLKKHGVTNVAQVITLRQLRTEYKTFESKRQLAAAYDVFLVDKKIAGVMPKTLGKSFFQSRKFPIQINMRSLDLKEEIKKKLSQSRFSLTCRGNSYSLEVARLSMENEAILQNIMTTVDILGNKLPGNIPNILSLYLKTAKSKALPIYVSLDDTNDVIIKKPRKTEKVGDDELSTLNDATVKVFRDGRVIVSKTKQSGTNEADAPCSDEMNYKEDTIESTSTEVSAKKRKSGKIGNSYEVTDEAELKNIEYTEDSINDKMSKKKKKGKRSITSSLVKNKDNPEDSINDNMPQKKKGKKSIVISIVESEDEQLQNEENAKDSINDNMSPKKKKKGKKSIVSSTVESEEKQLQNEENCKDSTNDMSPKKKKKGKKSIVSSMVENEENSEHSINHSISPMKKGRKSITSYQDVNEDTKSKNQTMDENDNFKANAQKFKNKGRKVAENKDSSDVEKNTIFKKLSNVSVVSEYSNVTTPKSKKEKKNKDVAKNETFLEEEVMQGVKTPSRSKKGERENAEVCNTQIRSSLSKRKSSNIDNIENNLRSNKKQKGHKHFKSEH